MVWKMKDGNNIYNTFTVSNVVSGIHGVKSPGSADTASWLHS